MASGEAAMDLRDVRFVGIDLAKRVFSVQLQAAGGEDLGSRKLTREEVEPFFASLPPCTVAMEACAGAAYWCELFAAQGHTPLPLHARAVSRLRIGHKNDKRDATLILLAARLPDARAVVLKSREQLAVLSQHRMRQLVVRHETACANQALAFLLEMGCTRWRTGASLRSASDDDIAREVRTMPSAMQFSINSSVARLRATHEEAVDITKALQRWHKSDPRSSRLGAVPGVGFIAASALAASIPQPPPWASGRSFAAFLGLVPVQHSTGGVERLGKIGHAGDPYLRRLLFLIGRCAAMNCYLRSEGPSCLVSLLNRKHFNVASAAHAARLARTCCQILIDGTEFEQTPTWALTPFKARSDTRPQRGGEEPLDN